MTEYSAPTGAYPTPYQGRYHGPYAGYAPPVVPPPPRRKRRMRPVLSLLLAFMVLVGVKVGVRAAVDEWMPGTRPALHTPSSLGSAPRLTSREAMEIEAEVEDGLAKRQKPQAGVYGRNGRPQYLLFAGYGTEETGRHTLLGFMDGFDGDATFGKPQTMAGGLVCTTVNFDGERGAACAWGGDESDGVVWALYSRDVAGLAKMTAKARTDVEAPKV